MFVSVTTGQSVRGQGTWTFVQKGKVIYTCLKRRRGDEREKTIWNPMSKIFCFGGKYVALWHPAGVSVAIRLFKASQWERGRASLSLLPCPPTGTDGHPRSSLISPQSGNDPCSWDVAALFKYDARCSPTFSMSSHCPRKPGGERACTSHHAACAAGWCAHCFCVYSTFSLFPFCFMSFSGQSFFLLWHIRSGLHFESDAVKL